MPPVSIVQVHDPRVRWGVRASGVVRIIPAAEWSAVPAVDVLASLGALPRTGARIRRVIVVRGARGREVALLAAGAIDIADVDAASVLALPGALADRAPQIAAIVVAHDASLSLLLELAAVITPDDIVVGEELCPSRS
jgi:chemotaxis signal transduction protein